MSLLDDNYEWVRSAPITAPRLLHRSRRWFPQIRHAEGAPSWLIDEREIVHYTLGVVGEIGELVDAVDLAQADMGGGGSEDREALDSEVADVAIYLMLFSAVWSEWVRLIETLSALSPSSYASIRSQLEANSHQLAEYVKKWQTGRTVTSLVEATVVATFRSLCSLASHLGTNIEGAVGLKMDANEVRFHSGWHTS